MQRVQVRPDVPEPRRPHRNRHRHAWTPRAAPSAPRPPVARRSSRAPPPCRASYRRSLRVPTLASIAARAPGPVPLFQQPPGWRGALPRSRTASAGRHPGQRCAQPHVGLPEDVQQRQQQPVPQAAVQRRWKKRSSSVNGSPSSQRARPSGRPCCAGHAAGRIVRLATATSTKAPSSWRRTSSSSRMLSCCLPGCRRPGCPGWDRRRTPARRRPPRAASDRPQRLERFDRFAHRVPADPQLLRQLTLGGQRVARAQPVVEDVALDLPLRRVDQPLLGRACRTLLRATRTPPTVPALVG